MHVLETQIGLGIVDVFGVVIQKAHATLSLTPLLVTNKQISGPDTRRSSVTLFSSVAIIRVLK